MWQIRWENRHRGASIINKCKVTVDGTDFRILEPTPFNKVWFSHKRKIKGPALRYEIAISIATGDIVWYNGPFPPGKCNDHTIFTFKLRNLLGLGEKIVADKGYKGDTKVVTELEARDEQHKRVMAVLRARHEGVNGFLKHWGVLDQVFRHDLYDHHLVFRACLVATQISFDLGTKSIFQVPGYFDPHGAFLP